MSPLQIFVGSEKSTVTLGLIKTERLRIVSQPFDRSEIFSNRVIILSSKLASVVLNCNSKLFDPLGAVNEAPVTDLPADVTAVTLAFHLAAPDVP